MRISLRCNISFYWLLILRLIFHRTILRLQLFNVRLQCLHNSWASWQWVCFWDGNRVSLLNISYRNHDIFFLIRVVHFHKSIFISLCFILILIKNLIWWRGALNWSKSFIQRLSRSLSVQIFIFAVKVYILRFSWSGWKCFIIFKRFSRVTFPSLFFITLLDENYCSN